MNYLSLLCLISFSVYYVECASMPLKFVTTPDRPTTVLDSSPVIVDTSNRHTGGKLIPSHVTVTSKPYHFVAEDDLLSSDVSGETALGAWRRWFAKENRTKAQNNAAQTNAAQTNPNEKTFTQQQIMEKLFSDYHKHLKEQGNSSDRLHRPTQVSSPWPLDTEPEGKPTLSVSPTDAISNFKYGYQPQYPQTHNYPQSSSYPQAQRPHNFHNNNNPPKDGWVSLEPVPWSTSKISKWTPNKVGSGGGSASWGGQKPGWTDRPQDYGDNRPWNDNKPPSYGDRPQIAIWNTDNKPQWGGEEEGGSAGWPHEPANKPGWTNTPVNNPPIKPSWSDIPSKPQWSGAGNPPATPKPWIDNKPGWSGNKPVGWNGNRPGGWNENKPGGWTDLNQRPTPGGKPPGSWRPAPEANHPLGIITDGRPPEWPSDPPASKPTSYPATWVRPQKGDWTRPVHSGNHPYPVNSELHYNEDDEEKTASTQASVNSSESGKWVLLSSTRGYTVPPLTSRGNRAFKFSASPNNMASISTNRGVRLTVLPALGNTSTLSHGGLLEVDKSFETVEDAAAASHASLAITSTKPLIIKHKRKPHHKKGKPARQQSLNGTTSGSPPPIQYFSTGSATSVELQNRNKALIAAIGAGMLPATVAALVPMFLGKRRRRRRSIVLDMLEEAQNRLRHSSLPRSTFNVTH